MRSARRVWTRDLRLRSLALAVGALACAGCGSVTSESTRGSTGAPAVSTATGPSGVVGRAVATVCEGADAGDQSCPRRPVLATIEVLQAPSQRRVASARANPAGWFRLVLTPGHYAVRAHAAGVLLWARAVTVRVFPHRFARVTLRLILRHPLPVGAPS